MFCGECGAKHGKDDLFCPECGATLKQEEASVKPSQTEPVKMVSEKKPMAKKTKIMIAGIVAVVLILGIGYKVGDSLTDPKKIAEDYIQATISGDSDKLYGFLELEGDTTFASKEVFRSLMEDEELSSDIENYKITTVDYGEGKLTATVNITYTIKGSSSEKNGTVNLSKQKDKKYFFFDNWKVADISASSLVVEDYTLEVPKGSSVIFGGVKVDSKYLSEEDSTEALDAYLLPQVFKAETLVKVTLSTGMEIEEEVTPSTYYNSHTVSFDEDSLSESEIEKITTKGKEILTTIYSNVIAKKEFSDIKSNFERTGVDIASLETNYNSFVSNLEDNSFTLTQIDFTDLSIYSLELNEDGNMEVDFKVNYDYTITYTNWSDEEQTHEDSDYDYIELVLQFDKNGYYLVDFDEDDLVDYFSRY